MPLSITCPACQATLRMREEQAGQPMKCPRCSADVPTTANEPLTVEPVDRAPQVAAGPTKPCPNCGKQIALAARKCRFCRSWLDDDEDDDDELGRSYFKPCPRCGASGAERVVFTFWGSFYGPALLTHVRCPQCGYAYNGRTGRSNLLWAILCVAIPLVLILAIIGGLIAIIVQTMS